MTNEVLGYSSKKEEMYGEVALQLTGLFEDCPHVIANLSNASAVLNPFSPYLRQMVSAFYSVQKPIWIIIMC